MRGFQYPLFYCSDFGYDIKRIDYLSFSPETVVGVPARGILLEIARLQ
jgi:hypothetical protein